MKTIKTIRNIMACLGAVLLSVVSVSCSSDSDILSEPSAEVPAELTLTLALPDYIVDPLTTRADANTLSSLCVRCYRGTTHLSDTNISSGWNYVGENTFEVTVGLNKETTRIEIVANMTVPADAGDMASHFVNTLDSEVFWGSATVAQLISKDNAQPITLIRHHAAVSVVNSTTATTPKEFKVLSYGVFGTATHGSIAPSSKDSNPVTPTIRSNESYSFNLKGDGNPDAGALRESGDIRVFESESEHGRIIICGSYGNEVGYYSVAFRKQSGSGNSENPDSYTYTPLSVLRNHRYVVDVIEVSGPGYKTIEEAYKEEPDNRATVLITDVNESINSIVSNADYMLGVADCISGVACTGGQIELDVITTHPQGNISVTTATEWMLKNTPAEIGDPTIQEVSTSVNKTGYYYKIKVKVEANTGQDDRTGVLTVRSGQLTRDIKVTQLGVDYKRDSQRKVTLLIGGATVTSDYFSWIDNTLQGEAPEDFAQEKIVRNDGLLYPAVPAYTAVYRIPRLSGDSNPAVSGGMFTLNTTGSYYEIGMTGQSGPGHALGSFEVTNSAGVTINYPLYRTGWLHELKESYRSYQRPGDEKSGWYYYEVIKVGNYWMLDRNLGASSNHPYLTTSAGMLQNERAVGGYFKISTVKSSSADNPSTIISSMGVSQFNIPKRATFEALGIQMLDVTLAGNEHAYVPYVSGVDIISPFRVYIPNGGYYEDNTLRCETYATLWTRSLVSGNQGFSKDSPDFGYWYQYLTVNGRKIGFSNMRMADGTMGEAPTDESVFKYMPIRLVWGNN